MDEGEGEKMRRWVYRGGYGREEEGVYLGTIVSRTYRRGFSRAILDISLLGRRIHSTIYCLIRIFLSIYDYLNIKFGWDVPLAVMSIL